jgi:CubicO group peptidase (beta-lactamase class C family)
MEDYHPSDGRYVTGAESVHPAYPFKMSVRDLARFALLYLNRGRWHDRQIVPAAWVEESTRAYSQSEFGTGYAYMWWTAPINSVVPTVNLPAGTFYAHGHGGQYAFVIPAYDLVVVHKAPHPHGDVNLRKVGRLLWLILGAGNFPDIGPDASLNAAQGMRATGEVLSRTLTGKTLLYGEATARPSRVRFKSDGTLALLRGHEPVEVDTGAWVVRDDKLCSMWKNIQSGELCLIAVKTGSNIQLFEPRGVMFIEGRVIDE